MRMFRGYLMMSLVALAAPALAALDRLTERIASFLLSLFAPEPLRLATDGPDLVRTETRPSLAAALLESLRHEKGVRHLRAARGI